MAMTNKEAIPILNYLRMASTNDKQKEALQKAITTMETQVRQLEREKRKRFDDPERQAEKNHRNYVRRKYGTR